jgi:hypothetical protein
VLGEFHVIQALIEFTDMAAIVVGAELVLYTPGQHVPAFPLIRVPAAHFSSPALLFYFQTLCLGFPKRLGHGLVEVAVDAVIDLVAELEINDSGFHPDTLVFQNIEPLNALGLTARFSFLAHHITSCLGLSGGLLQRSRRNSCAYAACGTAGTRSGASTK